jgi:hypothetical protein
MFQQLQGPKWYRNRPQNSGLAAVLVAFVLIAVGPRMLKIILSKVRIDEKSYALNLGQETHVGNKRPCAVEIIVAPQFVAKTSKPKRSPAKCRCHIDTEAQAQPIVHHDTRFAICKTIEQSDKAWAQGSYFKTAVWIRWHCVDY